MAQIKVYTLRIDGRSKDIILSALSDLQNRVESAVSNGATDEGTMQAYNCSRCQVQDRHVYRDLVKAMEEGVKIEDCLQCADCYVGCGNKDVINISVLHCLFCKWRIQTFFEYGIGKMRCTNCRYMRTSLGTAGTNND